MLKDINIVYAFPLLHDTTWYKKIQSVLLFALGCIFCNEISVQSRISFLIKFMLERVKMEFIVNISGMLLGQNLRL